MRLLVVVAHPDDESFGGSVLAHAAANRFVTAVVCATRGEAGESRIETDDLAALRESELRVAAGILGVGQVDHIAISDATLTAVDASAHPVAATYFVCLARSSMTRWADHMRTTGGGDACLAMTDLGTPELTLPGDRCRGAPGHPMGRHPSPTAVRPAHTTTCPEPLQHEFLAMDRLRLVCGVENLLS